MDLANGKHAGNSADGNRKDERHLVHSILLV
jgi:hypothetical protein